MDPNDAMYWCIHGMALDKLRRYEKAIESYDKAIEIAPTFHRAWCQKGITLNSTTLPL